MDTDLEMQMRQFIREAVPHLTGKERVVITNERISLAEWGRRLLQHNQELTDPRRKHQKQDRRQKPL